MQKATLSRIEFVIEGCDLELVRAAMVAAGWRKLRTSTGPMVFARDRWPKAVICMARSEKADLLGVNKHSNFETLLFLRTGTRLFINGVRDYLTRNGYTLRPAEGLFHGEELVAWTEEDIFTASGLLFVPPEDRYIFHPEKYVVPMDATF